MKAWKYLLLSLVQGSQIWIASFSIWTGNYIQLLFVHVYLSYWFSALSSCSTKTLGETLWIGKLLSSQLEGLNWGNSQDLTDFFNIYTSQISCENQIGSLSPGFARSFYQWKKIWSFQIQFCITSEIFWESWSEKQRLDLHLFHNLVNLLLLLKFMKKNLTFFLPSIW